MTIKAAGVADQDYGVVGQNYGTTFWMSPDDTLGYVIGHTGAHQGHTASGLTPANVGFFRSTDKTNESFISLAEYISRQDGDPQTFANSDEAETWLTNNGYWTSFTIPPTPSPTGTAAVTPTPSVTASQTPSVTPTETPTNTPSVTQTNTPTNTQTPTNTNTPTPSITASQTATPTVTPTNTQTPTNTTTPTKTPTPSITATQTVTPTNTVTNTPSVTTSNTPTNTPTKTPTPTPTKIGRAHV